MAGNYALTAYAIARSERQWCAILELSATGPAIEHPTPAQARAAAAFRLDVERIRARFHC